MNVNLLRIERALDDLHQDTSVPLEITLDNLEKARDHLDDLIMAVKEDIKRREHDELPDRP